MKRAALYMRVSTVDQHPETQLVDLRQMAAQRGYQIVNEYTDRLSGTKTKRPGLDQMMTDARRGRFDVILVWASDRIARSVKHFLEVLDELNRIGVEYVSFRENIDTAGPLGRAIVVIIGAIAELERSLIVERVRAGMRRARLEGQHIGRQPWCWTVPPSNKTASVARACERSPRAIAYPQPPSGGCSKEQTAGSRETSLSGTPLPRFKRGSKTHPANSIESEVPSAQSDCSKRCTFRYTSQSEA